MSSKTRTGKPTLGSSFHIKLNCKLNKTILSCGGQFKSTFSVAKGDTLFVSPTFGDLDHLENYEAFKSSIEKFFRKKIKPQLVSNGFRLVQNDGIPVGDSGISVGQALIVGARG